MMNFMRVECLFLVHHSSLHERWWKKTWQQRWRNHAIMGSKGSWWVGSQTNFVNFGFLKTLGLGTSVLEPDFHLGFRQFQIFGEFSTFSNREILLFFELIFKCEKLLRGEWCPGLAISFVFSEVATKWQPWVVSHTLIKGCSSSGHGCWASIAQKRMANTIAEWELMWWLCELRHPREELWHWSSLGSPGSGVCCSQVVQMLTMCKAWIHQGWFTAGSWTCAFRWWLGAMTSGFWRWCPWRKGVASELGFCRHAQDVVHAEGRGELAALLLFEVHWNLLVVIHVWGVVRARR